MSFHTALMLGITKHFGGEPDEHEPVSNDTATELLTEILEGWQPRR